MVLRSTSLAAGLLAALFLGAFAAAAQVPSSEKNHETDQVSRGPSAPLSRESSVLKIVKLKGSITKVDLEKRTVTVAGKKKKDGAIELSFPQPSGKEQIDVSKKAAKLLGKKNLELEELKIGSSVQLQYYTSLMQVMELIVEQPAR